jgi:hypothetical protein
MGNILMVCEASDTIVFGTGPLPVLVGVPEGVRRTKIVQRPNDWTLVILWYGRHRVERYHVREVMPGVVKPAFDLCVDKNAHYEVKQEPMSCARLQS